MSGPSTGRGASGQGSGPSVGLRTGRNRRGTSVGIVPTKEDGTRRIGRQDRLGDRSQGHFDESL